MCRVFDLRRHMRFGVEVVGACWDDDAAQWRVKLRRRSVDDSGVREESFEDTCDVFLYATGILNNWKWPKMDGLESFEGRIIHTARWPAEYHGEEQWKGQRVAVIGSGASSLQVVPSMQPHVAKMDVFVRTVSTCYVPELLFAPESANKSAGRVVCAAGRRPPGRVCVFEGRDGAIPARSGKAR